MFFEIEKTHQIFLPCRFLIIDLVGPLILYLASNNQVLSLVLSNRANKISLMGLK